MEHRKLNKGKMRARECLEVLRLFHEFLLFDHVFLAVRHLHSRSFFRSVQYRLNPIHFSTVQGDHNRMGILRAERLESKYAIFRQLQFLNPIFRVFQRALCAHDHCRSLLRAVAKGGGCVVR